jgi:hypothetical protein
MTFLIRGLILRMLEASDAKACTVGPEESPLASFTPEGNQTMTKSLEVISEVVSNPKHPFRKVDSQPKKPQKHRYERRKIKEYLHLADWAPGEAA